jgi:hypothetical protein
MVNGWLNFLVKGVLRAGGRGFRLAEERLHLAAA